MRALSKYDSKQKLLSVRFHPTENCVVAIGSDRAEVLCWDSSWNQHARYAIVPDKQQFRFPAIAVSATHDLLICSGYEEPLCCYRLSDGAFLSKVGSPGGYPSILIQGDRLFAQLMWEAVEIYSLPDTRLASTIPHGIGAFCLHPEGRLIAGRLAGDAANPIMFINGQSSQAYRSAYDTLVLLQALAFRPQGDLLVTMGHAYKKTFLGVFDFPSFTMRYEIRDRVVPYKDELNPDVTDNIVFSADGNTLFYPTHEGTIETVHVANGVVKKEYPAHEGPLTSIDIRHDLGMIVTAGVDGYIKLWDIGVTQSPVPPIPGLSDEFTKSADVLLPGMNWGHYHWKTVRPT